jgi:hypothetical protein
MKLLRPLNNPIEKKAFDYVFWIVGFLPFGIALFWVKFRSLQSEHKRIAPYVAELDQQASEAWQLFNGATNLFLLGLAALAIGTTLLIGWTIYRAWQFRRPSD